MIPKENSSIGTFLTRHPSAWLPILMSLVALAVVLAHVGISGSAHEADEGAAAHLWQLLMVAQLPIVAFFAIKWLPRIGRPAMVALALQLVAALTAVLPVSILQL